MVKSDSKKMVNNAALREIVSYLFYLENNIDASINIDVNLHGKYSIATVIVFWGSERIMKVNRCIIGKLCESLFSECRG